MPHDPEGRLGINGGGGRKDRRDRDVRTVFETGRGSSGRSGFAPDVSVTESGGADARGEPPPRGAAPSAGPLVARSPPGFINPRSRCH